MKLATLPSSLKALISTTERNKRNRKSSFYGSHKNNGKSFPLMCPVNCPMTKYQVSSASLHHVPQQTVAPLFLSFSLIFSFCFHHHDSSSELSQLGVSRLVASPTEFNLRHSCLNSVRTSPAPFFWGGGGGGGSIYIHCFHIYSDFCGLG